MRKIFFSLVVMALAGCAQLGGLDDLEVRQQRWQAQQIKLGGVYQWDLYARATVTLPGEAYNIGLQWKYKPEQYLLLIDAPFGQGVIRIEKTTSETYRLQLPDGRLLVNSSPEALLNDVIGWSIPISGLEYWIRGMPRPGSEYSHRLNNKGLAREISQDEWVVTYIDRFETNQQVSLPRRLRLAHDSVTMKLVIKKKKKTEIDDVDSDLFPEFN